MLFSCVLAAIFFIYASCPSYEHPFNNNWQTKSEWPWMSAAGVQVYFIFFLSMITFIYQTFLSILVFKVLCDVSVQYPAVHRGWRIKVRTALYYIGTTYLHRYV